MEPTTDALTPDEAIGLDILARAERPDGAITMEEATRIARAVGWPPPRLDDDGAIRAPTTDELARWDSVDYAIVDAMEWPEIGEEIEHRAPAIAASILASSRATVRALRDRDRRHGAEPIAAPADEAALLDGFDADAPVTDDEIVAWTRIGGALAADPRMFRGIVAVLSRHDTSAACEATQ